MNEPPDVLRTPPRLFVGESVVAIGDRDAEVDLRWESDGLMKAAIATVLWGRPLIYGEGSAGRYDFLIR